MPAVFRADRHEHKKGGRKKDRRVVDEVRKMDEEGRFHSHWGSISVFPNGARFESQGPDEVILLLMRRNFVTNLWWILLSIVLLFVPFFWDEFPLISMVSPNVSLSMELFWYLGIAFFVLQNLLLWFYNVYIVTDERIIDVDFFGLLYKNINVTQIRNVEDVNYSQIGIMSSVFNYGNVVIQTASEQLTDDLTKETSAFTFEAITNPDRVTRVISQLMEQEEQESYEGRVR